MPQADPGRAADKVAVELARKMGGSPDEHQQAAKQIAAGKLDQKAFLAGVDAAMKRQAAGEQQGAAPAGSAPPPSVSDPRIPTAKNAEEIRTFTQEEWGVPLSEGTAKYWEQELKGQKSDQDSPGDPVLAANNYLAAMQQNAAAMFPAFAEQIKSGVPPSGLLDGYGAIAHDELGRDVTLNDPVFRNAGAALNDGTMFRQYLRSLPEWDTGPKARQEADNLASRLSSMPIGESSGSP